MFFREEDVHLKELLARWAMAFPFVLMCHLRENSDVQKEVTVSVAAVCMFLDGKCMQESASTATDAAG